MKLYDYFKLVPPDYIYPGSGPDETHLSLNGLFRAANKANMKPLNWRIVNSHLFGLVMIGVSSGTRQFEQSEALAYAGITGIDKQDDTTLAVVGGVVTLPSARGHGLARKTIQGVLDKAPGVEAIAGHQPAGYKAVCNEASTPLFAQLGFTQSGTERGKQVMIKMFA